MYEIPVITKVYLRKINTTRMKRHISGFLLGLILISYGCNVCVKGEGDNTREIRLVSDFSQLVLNCSAEIILMPKPPDESTKVIVEAQPNVLPLITSQVSGETLEIDMAGCVSTTSNLVIYVYADNVNAVTNNSSGTIRTNNKINGGRFEVKLNGSGSIELELQANEVMAEQEGSGNILLKGNTNSIAIENDSSGSCDAQNLIANEAEVNLSGSGTVSVHATKQMNLQLNGSGSIIYSGQPEKLNTKKDGSGEIHEAQ